MITILSLCDYTGNWPAPYREAGYEVIQIDLKHGSDVFDVASHPEQLPPIHGVLAAPDCSAFTNSGAQYWIAKDADGRTAEGLRLVDACLDIIDYCNPTWWALENPVGRLPSLRPERLGPPQFYFDPCDYGDAYTKRTCLWGVFVPPLPLFIGGDWWVEPEIVCSQGSWLQALPGRGAKTKELRSATPKGFARAFYYANP